jgi:hypothetical protein
MRTYPTFGGRDHPGVHHLLYLGDQATQILRGVRNRDDDGLVFSWSGDGELLMPTTTSGCVGSLPQPRRTPGRDSWCPARRRRGWPFVQCHLRALDVKLDLIGNTGSIPGRRSNCHLRILFSLSSVGTVKLVILAPHPPCYDSSAFDGAFRVFRNCAADGNGGRRVQNVLGADRSP